MCLARIVEDGRPGEVYNIGGSNELTNLEIVNKLLALVGQDASMIRYVRDRPGHDRRYAIDSGKLARELGCPAPRDFDEGLAETVAWYRAHRSWWEPIRSGEFRKYYHHQYGQGIHS